MNKISARHIIADSYRFVFAHFGRIIERVWLPATLIFAGSILFVRPFLYLQASVTDNAELMQHGSTVLGMYGFKLISLLLSAMIAIAVVREVRAPDAPLSFWRSGPILPSVRACGGMIGLSLLFVLFVVVLMLVIGGLNATHLIPGMAAELIAAIAVIGLVYPMLRLGFLMVPAAEVGNGYGLTHSWQMSAGHFWRILLIALATIAPAFVVQAIAQTLAAGPEALSTYVAILQSPESMTERQAFLMNLMGDRLVLINGVSFFLTPFIMGLVVVPMALTYNALTLPLAGELDKDIDKAVTAIGDSVSTDKTEKSPQADADKKAVTGGNDDAAGNGRKE